MKVLTVVGARPQFIKAAVVSRALRARPQVHEVLVHTGQHYDTQMSDVFFTELDIPKPDYSLGIRASRHGAQTARMLETLEQVMEAESPDWVLVYGDTNSTLAGALAAAKLKIPIAHVEAGLRSFNRAMPEEINRVLTDHVSDRLFAPTDAAVLNLAKEGIAGARVAKVGDVMLDAAQFYAERAGRFGDVLPDLHLVPGQYILATVHRAGNTDDPHRLRVVFDALAAIASECPVVLPLHPRTRGSLERASWFRPAPGLTIIDPVGYLEMVMLEKSARLVVTDSGGVQKEAFFHRVLCVTLREETEWVELVETGWNTLAPPTDAATLTRGIAAALSRAVPVTWPDFYGNGAAAGAIVDLLCTGDARV